MISVNDRVLFTSIKKRIVMKKLLLLALLGFVSLSVYSSESDDEDNDAPQAPWVAADSDNNTNASALITDEAPEEKGNNSECRGESCLASLKKGWSGLKDKTANGFTAIKKGLKNFYQQYNYRLANEIEQLHLKEQSDETTLTNMELLLNEGANPNTRAFDGTPILIRSVEIYLESFSDFSKRIVELLLERGANINAQNENGKTALMLSIRDTGIVDGFFSYFLKSSPRCIDVLTFLLDKGADLNIQDVNGNTALVYAVMYGSEHIVRLFMERHPDITIRNTRGKTAFDVALMMGYFAIAQLINPSFRPHSRDQEYSNETTSSASGEEIREAMNVLGLNDALLNKKGITKAYRQLALTHHPDKPGGDKVKFQEISNAYQLLLKSIGEN